MYSRIILAVAATVAVALGVPVRADSIEFQITSSAAWRSNDTLVTGWETVGFDDRDWADARAPYPNPSLPTDLIPGTTAQFIWHDPDHSSDGSTGSVHAFLRFSFELDLTGTNASPTASASISVDDDYNLYVNGELVLENHDGGYADVVDTIDFAPYLRHGTNVIAIHAVDGRWIYPQDGRFERVLFDGSVRLPLLRIPILSGSDWLSNDTFEDDWETLDFDDAAWLPARAPYPGASPSTFIPDTSAQAMWHDPDATSDGTTGPTEAYFRYSFELNAAPQMLPVVGQAKINVDDDYDLYVNGILVLENHNFGLAHQVEFVDFTYALREGPNVIAIHAVDGIWGHPTDRGAERVVIDGLVASGVLDWQFLTIAEGDIIDCLSHPVLDDDLLVFTAFYHDCWTSPYLNIDNEGVIKIDLQSGAGEFVATHGPMPDGDGEFYFSDTRARPSLDNGQVAFTAIVLRDSDDSYENGIFFKDDGPVQTLVDDRTAVPGGTGTFNLAFSEPSLSEGQVAFSNDEWRGGIYVANTDSVSPVADTNTLMPNPDALPPGYLGNFSGFGIFPSLDRGKVAFLGWGPTRTGAGWSGLYVYDIASATFEIVADDSTLIPDGSGAFFGYFALSPAYADGQVAFRADNPTGNRGVYAWSEGVLRVVADNSTTLPDGRLLTDVGETRPTTSAGRTAFVARADGNPGLYSDIGLILDEVVGGDNPLPEIAPGPIDYLDLFHDGMSRNRIAVRVATQSWWGQFILVADDTFSFVADADGDGTADNADNCILDANSAQSDTNGDGYGNVCDPDLNGDGSTDFLDLVQFRDVFFGSDPDADLNQDGIVDFVDLAIVRLFFFGPPGPSALAD